MEKYPVYILAGGRSSRFGSDKARALLGDEPLITRLARQVEPIAESITIVADTAGRYTDLGLHTIADVHPGLGPLAGLHAALLDAAPQGAAARGEHGEATVLILSCDMTQFRPSWAALLATGRRSQAEACVFVDPHGRRHPFPGLYRARLADLAAQHLHARRLAMRDLLDAAGCATCPLPPDWPEVAQVNTPEELKRAAP